MSDMDQYLAQLYNTNGAAEIATEDMHKTANAELFCKLAADNGLDLSTMSDEQIAGVYAQVFPEDVGSDKVAAASEYVESKQEWAEKCAEADYMGRIMAHSFTQEREKIAGKEEAAEGLLSRAGKAIAGSRFGKAIGAHDIAEGRKIQGLAKKLQDEPNRGYQAMRRRVPAGDNAAGGKSVKDRAAHQMERGTQRVHAGYRRLGAVGAGTAATGTALAVGAHHALKKKESSAAAFEELAANQAIKIAEDAGYDVEEAIDRVSAIHTLGLGESEKIAYVNDVDSAAHVRGLEYLESAGYPVNWEEVFGG